MKCNILLLLVTSRDFEKGKHKHRTIFLMYFITCAIYYAIVPSSRNRAMIHSTAARQSFTPPPDYNIILIYQFADDNSFSIIWHL